VSFAAAIDAWAETEMDVSDDVVLVPLDKRSYAAELEDRLVEQEYLLGTTRLAEMMAVWQKRNKRAFATGATASALEGMRLETLPFELRAHRFRPVSTALTAAGLFAPTQVAAAAVVALAASAPQLDAGFRELWNATDPDAEQAARELAAKLEGSYGAASTLRGLADVGWNEAVLLMHRDGLDEMRFEDAFEVSFSGRSAAGFPQGAAAYAAAHAARFELTGERWNVRQPVPWGAEQRRSVKGFRAQGLAREIHAVANAARAELDASHGISTGPAEERRYALRIASATPRDLGFLATALAGRPFGLRHARCTFSDYLASTCEIGLVAKGMVE